MEHIDRRTLLKTTGAGAGILFVSGATNSTAAESVDTAEAELVSTVTADTEVARVAIDTDNPGEDQEELDIGEPLVTIENGEILDDGTFQVDETDIDVPDDLVDVLLALDPGETLVEFLEELDIEEDIIEEYDLDEDIIDPLVEFIEGLDLDQEQVDAIVEIVEILDEEIGLGIPDLVDIGDIIEEILLNPEEGIDSILEILEFIGGVGDIETTEDLVMAIIGLIDTFVRTTDVTFEFSIPTEEGTYTHGIASDDDSVTADITVGDPGGTGQTTPGSQQNDEADFQLSDDLEAPDEADPGETITASATVTNEGDATGTQDIEYEFDGTLVETIEDLTLERILDTTDLEEWLVEQAASLNPGELLAPVTVGVEPEPVDGLVDPDPAPSNVPDGAPEAFVLMTIPLTTVTLLPEVDPTSAQDPPEIEFDLGIELTTGVSNNLGGGFDPDTGGAATATVLDNEFTADITEFDLLELVEELDFVALLETAFEELGIDPEEYDIEQIIEDLDIPSIIENAELLELVDDLIEDEPGRHAVEADLALEFDDLDAVFEQVEVGPDELPGQEDPPQDLNGDGLYEDVTGSGDVGVADVQALFENLDSEQVQNSPASFNFSGLDPDEVNIFDVQGLFNSIAESED